MFRSLVLTGLVCCAALATDTLSPLETLDEPIIAAFEMEALTPATITTLRERSLLIQHLLSLPWAATQEACVALLAEEDESGAELQALVAEYGLSPQALLELLRVPCGGALLRSGTEEGAPCGLIWLGLPSAGAVRWSALLDHLLRRIVDTAPITREDFQLGQIPAHLIRRNDHQFHLLIARPAERLVIGFGPQAEQLEEQVGRLLSDQAAARAGAVLTRLRQQPSLSPLLGHSGLLSTRLVIDVPALCDLWIATANDPTLADQLTESGLRALGPLVVHQQLDDALIARSRLVLPMPASLPGLLACFDQPQVLASIPAWVDRNILDYVQIQADLQQIWHVIDPVLTSLSGPAYTTNRDQFTEQLATTLSCDLDRLLRALGRRHHFFTLPARPLSAEELVALADDKSMAQRQAVFTDRQAWVLETSDEELWSRLIQLIGMGAAFADGALQADQALGFHGWRLAGPQIPMTMSIHHGHGKAVWCLGTGTTDAVLSMIATQPSAAPLRESRLVREAQTLLPPRPSMLALVSDYGANLAQLHQQLRNNRTMLETVSSLGPESNTSLLEILGRLLAPELPRMDPWAAPGTAQIWRDDQALHAASTLRLP